MAVLPTRRQAVRRGQRPANQPPAPPRGSPGLPTGAQGQPRPRPAGSPGLPTSSRPGSRPARLTAPTAQGGIPIGGLPSEPRRPPRTTPMPGQGARRGERPDPQPARPARPSGRGTDAVSRALRGIQGGGDARGPAPAASSSPRGGGRSTPSPAQRAVSARLTTSSSSGFDSPKPTPRRDNRVTTENFDRFDNNPNRKPTVLRRAIAAREKTGLATTSFMKGERERFIKNYRATHKNKLSDAQITLIARYLKSKGKGAALFGKKKTDNGTLSGGES